MISKLMMQNKQPTAKKRGIAQGAIKSSVSSQAYHVYILKCKDKTLYTGIAVDLEKRVKEHNSSKLGAKYTKARRPVHLVFSETFPNRSLASKEEWRIKKMTKKEKDSLIKGGK